MTRRSPVPWRDQRCPNHRRLLVLAVLAIVPWSIQLIDGSVFSLRFVWGMISVDPPALSTLLAYVSAWRAPIVVDWLLAAGLFGLAVAAALLESLARWGDGRVTAGLLALAGLANLSVAWTFSAQPGRIAVPLGTVLLWAVAWRWWHDAGGLRADA